LLLYAVRSIAHFWRIIRQIELGEVVDEFLISGDPKPAELLRPAWRLQDSAVEEFVETIKRPEQGPEEIQDVLQTQIVFEKVRGAVVSGSAWLHLCPFLPVRGDGRTNSTDGQRSRELLQRIQRSSYLIIRRALTVIGLNPGPRRFSGLIDYVNRGMWNAVVLRPLVSRIAETVGIDDLVVWIGE
jgi:hypothetical protein